MAGKANKTRSRGKSFHRSAADSSEASVSKEVSVTVNSVNGDASQSCGSADSNSKAENDKEGMSIENDKEGMTNTPEATSMKAEGDQRLYPITIKTQSGEKLELQLSPGDSVIDIRQFLLDAPETCFFTCYDLVLHAKDGSTHLLGDYNEISEVADITSGGCSLEMVGAPYDDRSIRSHVHRARDLLSLSNLHTSLSTSLALQHEHSPQKSPDFAKVETPELDGLGFMEDVTNSIGNLVVLPEEIKCLEIILFSSFNPPPSYRRNPFELTRSTTGLGQKFLLIPQTITRGRLNSIGWATSACPRATRIHVYPTSQGLKYSV
ncbi:hypothetical protein HPP92_003007 [Vanilla planifolia]|uniref:Clustered mitochondria protein N-terminal domain-containing protein n=1 Tax=Vanilla planifolia TaxID=51239 RepID=A0A835S1E4_VANPL|nr:hypothetical protein HPP92_003007 [Vanilla planifolia]